MGKASLGDLDELVLLAVAMLYDNAYAFAIKQALEDEADRVVALPTVHAALYRLEQRGYLHSSLGGATAARGGRRKRLFRITNAGLAALHAARSVREQMWQRIQERAQPLGGLT